MKKTEEGWAVYSELADSIGTTLFSSDDSAIAIKKQAVKGRMPYESEEEAEKRYRIVKVKVTYNL